MYNVNDRIESNSLTNFMGDIILVGSPILYFGACTGYARVGKLLKVVQWRYSPTALWYYSPLVQSAVRRKKFIYDPGNLSGGNRHEDIGIQKWSRWLSANNVFKLDAYAVQDPKQREILQFLFPEYGFYNDWSEQ